MLIFVNIVLCFFIPIHYCFLKRGYSCQPSGGKAFKETVAAFSRQAELCSLLVIASTVAVSMNIREAIVLMRSMVSLSQLQQFETF